MSDQKPRTASIPAVAGASMSGTAIEWYDFFLYGTASALVFPHVFFPSADPLTGTLVSFSTYAVGFIARPFGAAFWGHRGDTAGRRATLIWCIVLMGVATVCMGLLPSHATIGTAAPVLLLALRLVQGFALGGEWGGAILFTAEHSSSKYRAFWASWPGLGAPLGNLIASGVLAALRGTLSDAAFFSWGWRIAFFLSAILVAVGLILRLKVQETPIFSDLKTRADGHEARTPLLDVFRNSWRAILLATLARFGDNSSYYTFSVFLVTYVNEIQGFQKGLAVDAVTIGMAICAASIPLLALLADGIGRRPILLAAALVTLVWPFVFFTLVDTGSFGLIILAVGVGLFLHAMYDSSLGPFYAELFPTETRYSGMSISYNLGTVFAGGLAPIIAIALFKEFESSAAIAVYIAIMGLISGIALLLSHETRGVDLRKVKTGSRTARVGRSP